jgi:hypothetical protein
MILVIKQGNGESYEDYHEYISGVFQINRKGLTADKIDKEHKAHITKICESIGLVVNPHWPEVIMDKSLQPEGKTPSKELKKQHKQILKDNDLYTFIKNTYKAKQLDNVEDITIY